MRGVPGGFRRVTEALTRIKKRVKVNSILTRNLVGDLERLIAFRRSNGYAFGYGVPLRHGPPFFLSSEVDKAMEGLMPTRGELDKIFETLTRHRVASESVLRSARRFMDTGTLDFDHCINPYVMVMVYWNGDVRAGCFGFEASGNLYRQTLSETLGAESYAKDARDAYRMDCARECVACTLSSAAASPLSSLPYVLTRLR